MFQSYKVANHNFTKYRKKPVMFLPNVTGFVSLPSFPEVSGEGRGFVFYDEASNLKNAHSLASEKNAICS